MTKLKRYWFKFDSAENLPIGIIMGCGITAYNREDALLLLKNDVFKREDIPNPIVFIENIDVSTLDQGHVIPNMSSPDHRGVWFPLGYD